MYLKKNYMFNIMPKKTKQSFLNFDDFKKIIDEGEEYGCPSLSPQGNNEPFLIKDLHKYINYAHKRGFIDIMLNNNGSAMPKKKAQQILDSGLTRIRFSLDAIKPETYKNVRVGSIPLERVIRNRFFIQSMIQEGTKGRSVKLQSFAKQTDF